MPDASVPGRLPKWPFYIADAILSGIAGYVLYRLGTFEGPFESGLVVACLLAAAWGAKLSITPWLEEHKTLARLAESSNLTSALEQVKQIEIAADQIRQANSQWQSVHDSANLTATAAREIADRMKAETEDFMKFVQNAHDQERSHLRLEVEKLRRTEGDWLKVVVQMMDHIYALRQVLGRLADSSVLKQVDGFQNVCRDVARRIGLTPFTPAIGESFDSRGHQLPDPEFQVPSDSRIGEVLATGYMYQGQLLRRALVLLAKPEPAVENEVKHEIISSQSGPVIEESNPSSQGSSRGNLFKNTPEPSPPPESPRAEQLPLV